jgi:pullulanase-type alpha-1,6-glucosidase
LQRNEATGVWTTTVARLPPGATYTYAVEVFVPSMGWVRNRVTDPYSVSLTADSQRSAVLDLNDPALQPRGWRQRQRPAAPESPVDMAISELHVRDFSVFDRNVPPSWRGKYLAFTHARSQGVRHLRSLAQAGLKDVHLLPIFDWATAPETHCEVPDAATQAQWRKAPGDHPAAAEWVRRHANADCFNWGYDPWHFNAPEGSFATDARDPAVRIRELRAMVMALQGMGLRVGMDVVYNHMSAAGQHPKSALDRLVPGYYHRLNALGEVERSTCCDNTATEHRMMRRLMIDSAVHWVRHFGIDSFRFDLMGHQPREAMLALQKAVDQAAGRFIPLLGEGWNFGEIANNARFIQAAQGDLNGAGIGTFNDRLRDAARGTRHGDDAATTVTRRGWLTGASDAERAELADAVRAGLAGSVASLRLKGRDGEVRRLADRQLGNQVLGYASEPTEVVNYVENHDNPTLFDLLAFKLPQDTPAQHRAERQVLGGALVLLAQGVPYLHAGQEILRSKSLDLNSYDSGDWFNGMDWSLATHGFGRGMPPGQENAAFASVMTPRLADASLRMDSATLAWSLGAHRDLLRVRAQTPLLRLRTAEALRHRVRPLHLGPGADPSVVLMWWDGLVPGPGFDPAAPHAGVLVALNTADQPQAIEVLELQHVPLQLHPVFQRAEATDRRLRAEGAWRAEEAQLSLPARSASVWVLPANSALPARTAPK